MDSTSIGCSPLAKLETSHSWRVHNRKKSQNQTTTRYPIKEMKLSCNERKTEIKKRRESCFQEGRVLCQKSNQNDMKKKRKLPHQKSLPWATVFFFD
jgi:hypothetical protein